MTFVAFARFHMRQLRQKSGEEGAFVAFGRSFVARLSSLEKLFSLLFPSVYSMSHPFVAFVAKAFRKIIACVQVNYRPTRTHAYTRGS